MKSYKSGFKTIFTNLTASLIILGMLFRLFETSLSGTYMTKSFEVYTSVDVSYTNKYSLYSSIAILVGALASNLLSIFLVEFLGEENPMTIPYVCIIRNLFDIIALYMMFWVQDSFSVSIIGFYIQQILGEGWFTPALLML